MGQEKIKSNRLRGIDVKYEMITASGELESICMRLLKEKQVSVDLEADSMYHFKEKVCLLQIATPGANFIIDPLKIGHLDPLRPLFASREIQKIFHGADYDVRSLYRDFKISINNLFDTQLACRFLGMRETGLDAALLKKLDVRIVKKYQKKDWSQRPLPQEMLAYAVQDVIYLIPLYELLSQELRQSERFAWVQAECRHLSKVRPAAHGNQPLFISFKGAGRFDPRHLAVLEALLQMRKKIAAQKDKPLFKVLSNSAIMQMTLSQPHTLRRLQDAQILSPKQLNMHGGECVRAIQKGLKLPPKQLLVYPRKNGTRLNPAIVRRIRALREWRELRGAALKLDPALLCSKESMNAIAQLKPQQSADFKAIAGMRKWQLQAFAKEIIAVLRRLK